jgi:hypothetical protein
LRGGVVEALCALAALRETTLDAMALCRQGDVAFSVAAPRL